MRPIHRTLLVIVLLAIVLGILSQTPYGPALAEWGKQLVNPLLKTSAAENHAAEDPHDHHDHGSESGQPSLELSAQARKNLGLTAEFLKPLERSDYYRTLKIPAVVVERPGKTRLQISTPLTGTILDIYVVAGETVTPGTPLFRIRLTHEDLVQTQTLFLQTLGERDVELMEMDRLKSLSDSGAVAGRVLLERQYAYDKLNAQLQAQREALRLHGLSDRQIETVEKERRLLQELEIVAISPLDHKHEELHFSPGEVRPISSTKVKSPSHQAELIVQNLQVHKGESVQAGEALCELADYSQLLIEGKAFEKDAAALQAAEKGGWKIAAMIETANGPQQVQGLELAYIANAVDVESRVLPFYVKLPNRLLRDQVNSSGQRYVTWQYRTGQRLQLQVPVEEWKNEFVVPVDAVVREGAEFLVFRENGKHFEQVPVHVKYRDQYAVVIADDGALFPGDTIALKSAHQILMAIKNQAGGGIDPHAGHNH